MSNLDFAKQLKKSLSAQELKEIELICFEKIEQMAQEGHPEAQFHLACWYFLGEYVEKNIDRAFYWFEKSAEQGNSRALEILKIRNSKEG